MSKKYLEEMELEYKKICGSYAKMLAYISKMKDSKDLKPEEKEEVYKIEQRFRKKINYMNNFLKENQ